MDYGIEMNGKKLLGSKNEINERRKVGRIVFISRILTYLAASQMANRGLLAANSSLLPVTIHQNINECELPVL